MSILSDGVWVFFIHSRWMIGLIALILTAQFLNYRVLRIIFKDAIASDDLWMLAFSGWIIPILLIALIYFKWGMTISLLFFIVFLILILRLKTDPRPVSPKSALTLALFLIFSLLIRFAFVSQAVFPSYFDSAEHYTLIKSILENDSPDLLRYCHLGFHYLAAWIASIFQIEIQTVMLIFGQVVLALLPVSLFFIVKQATGSDKAGWLGMILSAFGWSMPAHAVDWGKYPALLSLGLILFVLNLFLLFVRRSGGRPFGNRLALFAFFIVSMAVTVFTHSRAIVLFGVLLLVWLITLGWIKLSRNSALVFFMVIVAFAVGWSIYIAQFRVVAPLFDAYLVKGTGATLLVLFLSVFAWKEHAYWVFACALMIGLLMLAMFVPIQIPDYGVLTLLDRPYVQMILYMPLSLLGGLGLAGLEKRFQSLHTFPLLIALIVLHALVRYDFYPDRCCVLVGWDDAEAMAWLQNLLPVNARIGVASAQLNVFDSDVFEGYAGSDAGVWVAPLTDRSTIPLPYDLDFERESALELICQNEITHLFVGTMGETFDANRIMSRPEWYTPLLSLGKTGVYEVIGCD